MSYQEKRDALIGMATKEALERVAEFRKKNKGRFLVSKHGEPYITKEGCSNQRNYCHDLFTEFFHASMDRLAREKGIVR